jgi:hypothetical protein
MTTPTTASVFFVVVVFLPEVHEKETTTIRRKQWEK